MTVGAAASLTCTLNAITNPGDEVIVIAPYFPEYRVWIEKAGCTCVEALANETFQLSVGNVLKAITDKTAAVIIDSPNNPTGAVYTRDTLTRLANVLREVNAKRDPENPITLLSDEPYREIVYSGDGALGAFDLRAHHRVLLVFQVAFATGRARRVDSGSQYESSGSSSHARRCWCRPYAGFRVRTSTPAPRDYRLHR